MFFRTIILATMLLTAASTAQAASLDGHGSSYRPVWEFTMQTIYTASQDIQGEGGSSLELQDNLGWGFGMAYNFNQRFSLGMEFSWSSINYTAAGVSAEDPSDIRYYSNNLDVSSTVFTGQYNIMEGRFTPYISGSLGWSLIDTNIFAGYENVCYWDPLWGYMCGTATTSYGTDAAVYGMGLGARYQVTPKFFVSGSYDYRWLDIDAVDANSTFRFKIGFLH